MKKQSVKKDYEYEQQKVQEIKECFERIIGFSKEMVHICDNDDWSDALVQIVHNTNLSNIKGNVDMIYDAINQIKSGWGVTESTRKSITKSKSKSFNDIVKQQRIKNNKGC